MVIIPNWAKGVLKVRGSEQAIANYLKEVCAYVTKGGENIDAIVEVNIVLHTCSIKPSEQNLSNYIYLRDTKRAFIDCKEIDTYLSDCKNNQYVVELPNFIQAWSVEANDFTRLSRKHGVDIKIFGYEDGLRFSQEIEIIKGVVTKNEKTKYDDWMWDVPFSQLGG